MRVQELTKQYDGKTVVDGVSFAIPKGKVISLIGPNGAGKSTVMGMISRLIAHDSGLVDFEGKDIGKWKSKELSKRLAILTQSNNIQMKLTVRELVTFGRFPYSGNRVTPEDQKIIDRAIHYMELEEFQDRFIDELSGGQRQRALIAMVIAQDTEYVLLDEPTNGGASSQTTSSPSSSQSGGETQNGGAPESVTITSLNANKEAAELEVPYDPQRIAILDMASLDILDALGVGDRVVGTADTSLEYLQDYINDDIANLGTIKEADLEAVMACEPDVIFIGGRLASSYDALSEIAPVVYLATDTELGVVESVRQNATTIASMFGLEDKVDELMANFDARITALSEFAAGKTAIVGLVTSGSYNVLGNDGRCSMIGREIGFENIGVDANIDTSTHGNEASFEFIVEKAPDYIFVLDRDAAIGTDGAKLAQEIMENELVMGTDAYKNGNIVYLAHPAVWYTAEGGISALDIMLQDLESELLG